MIADRYLQIRNELDDALSRLLKLGSDIHRPDSWVELVKSLFIPVREPLQVVIIGDTQSGKTTLLSALFEHDLPNLSAGRICLLQYGDKINTVDVSPRFAERYLPISFLRQFKLLGTPGTDKLGPEDRQLTHQFIQQADLVFVVLSAANPWTHTTWDFLDSIDKTVLKNMVYVLQQADLRDERAIDVVQRHFEDMARQKIGFAPPIFAVSGRDALLARDIGSEDDRARVQKQFAPLREQINLVVGQSGGRTEKLRSACQLALMLLHEIVSERRGALDIVTRDEARLSRANALLHTRKEQTQRRVADLLRQVEQAGKTAAAQGLPRLKAKLAPAQTWKTLRGQFPQPRDFQLEIDQASRESIERQIEETAQLLESDLRALWPQLHDLIYEQLGSDIKTELPQALPDFAGERRKLLHAVQMAMSARASVSNLEDLSQLFRRTAVWLRVPAAAAVVCALVALLVWKISSAIAGLAAILAGLAIAAGMALAFYRRQRIVAAYQNETQRRVTELIELISWQFNETIDSFHNQIAAGFEPLQAHCAREREKAEPLVQRADELQTRFGELNSRLR
jgi:signal recognition particle receptor subunit beta